MIDVRDRRAAWNCGKGRSLAPDHIRKSAIENGLDAYAEYENRWMAGEFDHLPIVQAFHDYRIKLESDWKANESRNF